MSSKVIFEIKSSARGWSDQVISFSTREIKSVLINIKDTRCELSIDGNNEDENLKNIIVIWEIIRICVFMLVLIELIIKRKLIIIKSIINIDSFV